MARSNIPNFVKRAPRVDLRRPAVLVDSDGGEADVTILDISGAGFRISSEVPPRIGEYVTLKLGKSGDLAAQIRWSLGDEAGGVFLNSVHPELWPDSQA